MRFQAEVNVIGMKMGKGEVEGTSYDYTRVFVEQPLDTSRGEAVGSGVEAYQIGTSTVFAQFSKLPFPHKAVLDLELVTTGKTSKTVVHGYQPKAASAKPASAADGAQAAR